PSPDCSRGRRATPHLAGSIGRTSDARSSRRWETRRVGEGAREPSGRVAAVLLAAVLVLALAGLAGPEEERLHEFALSGELVDETAMDALESEAELALGHDLLRALGLPAGERE